MIDEKSTLIDVAFAACTALHHDGITAILTGGSAATYYAPSAYQSRDADFVLRFATNKTAIAKALATISFTIDASNIFKSKSTKYTIDFPRGPLMAGSREIEQWSIVHRNEQVLNVLDVTDCVRDRFMGFYAWGDYGSLAASVAVAAAHPAAFDREDFDRWAKDEAANDPLYDPARVDTFFKELSAAVSSSK